MGRSIENDGDDDDDDDGDDDDDDVDDVDNVDDVDHDVVVVTFDAQVAKLCVAR